MINRHKIKPDKRANLWAPVLSVAQSQAWKARTSYTV